MPIVLPSQIVEFIDNRFPEVKEQFEGSKAYFSCDKSRQGKVSTILQLIDQIPPYLLTISGEDFIQLMEAINELKVGITTWVTDPRHVIRKMRDGTRLNPITIIRIALSKCPDEGVEDSTDELLFIADPDFRETIRQDISSTNQALANSEWKATTVLAGSVIEALLLNAILKLKDKNPKEFERVRNKVIKDKRLGETLSKKLSDKPTGREWGLHQYIYFTFSAGIISETTAKECLLTKDFRNLIHPGRAERRQQKCDRGTALQTVGGMVHVIKELS